MQRAKEDMYIHLTEFNWEFFSGLHFLGNHNSIFKTLNEQGKNIPSITEKAGRLFTSSPKQSFSSPPS